MAVTAFLRLKGQVSGDIKGSVTQKGREGRILVVGAEHGIASPRDPASGQATGRRSHKPFVITKPIDRSTPVLYGALVRHEVLTEWDLQFWRQVAAGPGAGTEQQYYTVDLTNAVIVSIEMHMPNARDPGVAQLEPFEEVGFAYQKIQWIWTDGGITASDTWTAPV